MQFFIKPNQRWYKSDGYFWTDQSHFYQFDGHEIFTDPERLICETKATPLGGGYLLNRKPKRPLWEYTVFAPYLRALGAEGITLTTNARPNNGRASYVALIPIPPFSFWNRVSSDPKTTLLFSNGIATVAIQSTQYNRQAQFCVYFNPGVGLTNLTTIENLASDDPNCVVQAINQKLLGSRLSTREQQVSSIRYELNVLLASVERKEAELNQALLELELLRSSETSPPDASNLTPQITSLRLLDDRLIITTTPLTARVELNKWNSESKEFSLGSLALVIPADQWSRVTCLPIGIGPAPHSHPHANGSCICLGNTFTRTAIALQDRGELVLYLNLLIDHLQNGVDPRDSLGCRVIMWPEVAHEVG